MPSGFDEETEVLDGPPGTTAEECAPLSVFRGDTAEGHPVVISCWKPTREEWDEMRRTGRVWLIVSGHTMPPVAVTGTHPFDPIT